MPAQALIRKMNKDKVASLITSLGAAELLEFAEQPDGVLLRCKPGPGGVGNLEGAHEKLQAICDEDSKIVRAEAKAAADKLAAEAEAAKAAATPAPAPAAPPATPKPAK